MCTLTLIKTAKADFARGHGWLRKQREASELKEGIKPVCGLTPPYRSSSSRPTRISRVFSGIRAERRACVPTVVSRGSEKSLTLNAD